MPAGQKKSPTNLCSPTGAHACVGMCENFALVSLGLQARCIEIHRRILQRALPLTADFLQPHTDLVLTAATCWAGASIRTPVTARIIASSFPSHTCSVCTRPAAGTEHQLRTDKVLQDSNSNEFRWLKASGQHRLKELCQQIPQQLVSLSEPQ